jgi:hypothetical protein
LLGGVVVAAWLIYQGPSRGTLAVASQPWTDTVESRALGTPRAKSVPDARSRGVSSKIKQPGSISVNGLLHQLIELGESGELALADLHEVRDALLDLLSLGRSAVPDIRSFLLSGDDAAFHSDGGPPFEFASLRLALIDLLKQIGGLEAEQALMEQLYARVSVPELKAIADALESLQPDFYSESILTVAREWLTEFSAKEAPDVGMESGPLFQVLQTYGGNELAATLYEVPYWLRGYAQVALAHLPGGEGIDGLAQMARRDLRRSEDRRSLHLLAQASVFQPQAEAALLALAESDQIPDSEWSTIGEILTGDRQLRIGNPAESPQRTGSLRGANSYATHTIVDRQVQVLYSVNYSAVLSPADVSTRLDLISRMLDASPGPAANIALAGAQKLLIDFYF